MTRRMTAALSIVSTSTAFIHGSHMNRPTGRTSPKAAAPAFAMMSYLGDAVVVVMGLRSTSH